MIQPEHPNMDDGLDTLRRCIALAGIAHQMPGRVRLKLDAGAKALRRIGTSGIGPEHFGRALEAVAGIRRVHLNKLARSVTIEYDNRAIPDVAWPDLLAGRASPEATGLLNRLWEAYPQAIIM